MVALLAFVPFSLYFVVCTAILSCACNSTWTDNHISLSPFSEIDVQRVLRLGDNKQMGCGVNRVFSGTALIAYTTRSTQNAVILDVTAGGTAQYASFGFEISTMDVGNYLVESEECRYCSAGGIYKGITHVIVGTSGCVVWVYADESNMLGVKYVLSGEEDLEVVDKKLKQGEEPGMGFVGFKSTIQNATGIRPVVLQANIDKRCRAVVVNIVEWRDDPSKYKDLWNEQGGDWISDGQIPMAGLNCGQVLGTAPPSLSTRSATNAPINILSLAPTLAPTLTPTTAPVYTRNPHPLGCHALNALLIDANCASAINIERVLQTTFADNVYYYTCLTVYTAMHSNDCLESMDKVEPINDWYS